MTEQNKPWELKDSQIDELTPNSYGKNITEGRQVAHAAQRKLLEIQNQDGEIALAKLEDGTEVRAFAIPLRIWKHLLREFGLED